MKHTKKRILAALLVAVLTVGLGATAFAASTARIAQRQQVIAERQAAVESKRAEIESKMGGYQEFRQQLEALRLEVLANKDENLALAAEVNDLRLSIVQQVEALKESVAALPQQDIDALKNKNGQVKGLAKELRATRGQIKSVMEANRENYKAKDYDAMVAAFSEMEAIQFNRNGLLQQMKAILQEMDAVLASAA